MPMTDSFEQFLSELKQKVNLAQSAGASDRMIADHAAEVGDFLSRTYDPKNPEQRVLKELWDVSDAKEQQAIASAMFKLVERRAPAGR